LYVDVPTFAKLNAGFQVPSMPLVEVVGKVKEESFWQTDERPLKVGTS
jgi:hypothetical protein